MSTPAVSPALDRAVATTTRLRQAAQAGDVEGFVQLLAPDVVLHSPITTRVQFRGRDELRTLMTAVFASLEDLEYFAETGDETTRALFLRARIGRQDVEEAMLVRLGDDGLVAELRVWFRPMPGLATLMAALGPKLARTTKGRMRAVLITAMTKPLVFLTRTGDAAAVKLVF
ncbi:MAG: nuclear transport factor 2 family protein [Solirubrobacteraceae bacterium]|nr:nuclear transport factor 2 family protein [Solirubrobacteraceae bacterium]